jgi:flagellin-like protein
VISVRVHDRSVSPVVGIALLLVVVILLAMVLFAMATGFGIREPAPQVATEQTIHSKYDASSNAVYQYLNVTHRGGDPLDPDELKVVVRANGDRYVGGSPTVTGADALTAGDEMGYNLSSTNLCSMGADAVEVTVIHEPTNLQVAKQDVHIERTVDLSVEGNEVGTDTNYVATAEIVGIGASASGGPNEIRPDLVNARIVLNSSEPDRTVLTPWPDGDPTDSLESGTDGAFDESINDPGRPDVWTYSTGELSKNKTITVEIRAPKPNGWTSDGEAERVVDGTTYTVEQPDRDQGLQSDRYWVDTTDPDDGTIQLLEDGDQVPTYGLAADHQRSLHEMLGGRLDGSGTLQLDDNEVVALYELSTPGAEPEDAPDPGTGGNPDYNDAVAIIEVQPIPESSTGISDSNVVYCT